MIVGCPSCARANRLPAARLRDRARCPACKAAILPPSQAIIPTLICFRAGAEAARVSGAMPAAAILARLGLS